jgi:4-hydroxy-tetrahydrodipicolinate synthase
MSTTRKEALVGPVICLRTFRTEDGKLNLDKQRRHLRWLLDQGINKGNGVIMFAGGGSEGYFLSPEEWKASVDLLAEECKGRAPSMAGIFELSATECAKKAAYCASLEIDFVQVQPPHYMVPTDDEVVFHYQIINEAADVGIVLYNAPWAMPRPGYEFTPPVLEQLIELKNVEGLKWSSWDMRNYVACARLFADEINFINNQPHFVLSLPIKLGFTGFLNAHGNCAPRLALHIWELWKNKQYDAYDEFILKMYVDPGLQVHMPEEFRWRGMGEGPLARLGLEAMGCKMGPPFPAQRPLSEAFVKNFMEGYEKSGIAEWVDWQD